MVFPAICFEELLAVLFVLNLLSTNHIRVLTSANQSYLIIGLKQPINCKENVIWQMSKNKKFTYVMIYTLDS